ncbi:hypothetical protein [Streptomyces sp. NPDC002132]|uniref:hypothetical protein n=1 Tax=unclassified Streptomyces TaxID=2593676 RepID=UPI003333E3CD
MSHAADGLHPHPLTPADLPAGDEWWHGCHLPFQGGAAGLTEHRRTVHTSVGDHRRPITVHLEF